jgi:hypothetical protein
LEEAIGEQMSFIGIVAGSTHVASEANVPMNGNKNENFSWLSLYFHQPGLLHATPNTFTFQGGILAPSGQPTAYGRPNLTKSEMLNLDKVFDFKISGHPIKNAEWAKNWAKEQTIKFLEGRADPVKLIEWTNLRFGTYVLVNVGTKNYPPTDDDLVDMRKNIVNWLGKDIDLITHHAIKIKILRLKEGEKVHFMIGTEDRPALQEDVEDLKKELENSITEMRPIVTHYAVKMRKYKF